MGYIRQLGAVAGLVPGLGVRIGVAVVPEGLKPFYGSRTPVGFAIFASLRPRAMAMGTMAGMQHQMPMSPP